MNEVFKIIDEYKEKLEILIKDLKSRANPDLVKIIIKAICLR